MNKPNFRHPQLGDDRMAAKWLNGSILAQTVRRPRGTETAIVIRIDRTRNGVVYLSNDLEGWSSWHVADLELVELPL